jgi:uncharacterized membrane protein YeaQ/YmgE (transglycosylase-associated protein family)
LPNEIAMPRKRSRCDFGAIEEELRMNFIVWLIIGGLAGWLAGKILQGGGFGIIGNIVIGICGSVLAGWLLPQVGFHIGSGLVSDLINALIGALIIVAILAGVRRR